MNIISHDILTSAGRLHKIIRKTMTVACATVALTAACTCR